MIVIIFSNNECYYFFVRKLLCFCNSVLNYIIMEYD